MFQSFPKPDASPTPCADGGHFPRTLQAAEGKQSTATPLLIEWVPTVCLGTQGGCTLLDCLCNLSPSNSSANFSRIILFPSYCGPCDAVVCAVPSWHYERCFVLNPFADGWLFLLNTPRSLQHFWSPQWGSGMIIPHASPLVITCCEEVITSCEEVNEAEKMRNAILL